MTATARSPSSAGWYAKPWRPGASVDGAAGRVWATRRLWSADAARVDTRPAMTVDQPKFEERIGTSSDGLMAHTCVAGDLARTHREIAVEHGEGHGDGAGAAGYGLGLVFEDVHALDPAKQVLGERGPVRDRHGAMVAGLGPVRWRTGEPVVSVRCSTRGVAGQIGP